jgi:hypothetical protein
MRRFLLLIVAAVLVMGFKFTTQFEGIHPATPSEPYHLENLSLKTYEPTQYEDIYNLTSGGVALLDLAHKNSFDLEELSVLLTRVVARNYTVKYLLDKAEMNKSLKASSTYIVISPGEEYTEKEVDLVEKFIQDNGTLLLIDDPSRNSHINILSLRFGIVFNRDYLYNIILNDGNYRYVVFKEFAESNLTRGLDKVVLYVAESIAGDAERVFLPDSNTTSSHGGEALSPVVEKNRILAIGDITFLSPSYSLIHDNNRFISNIADFVTSSPRKVPQEVVEEKKEEKKPQGNETA